MVMATRRQLKDRVREWSSWAAAALMGVGVALCLTIIFLEAGSKLILAAAATGLSGWLLGALLPRLLAADTITCPRCRTGHEVLRRTALFRCEGCGRQLRGRRYWTTGKTKTKRKLPVPAYPGQAYRKGRLWGKHM